MRIFWYSKAVRHGLDWSCEILMSRWPLEPMTEHIAFFFYLGIKAKEIISL